MGNFQLEQVYLYLALIASALFGIKFVMILLGADSGDGFDFGDGIGDAGMDGSDLDGGDTEAAFNIISLQSFLAFFLGLGWVGWSLNRETDWGQPVILLAAAVVGGGLMLLNAFLMYLIFKMESIPKYNLESCVGETAKVYLSIPPKGDGQGQIELNVDGRLRIFKAISNGPGFESFEQVRVASVDASNELIVVESL